MTRLALFLASLSAFVVFAPPAEAATLHYEIVFTLVPGDVPLASTGGPTFDSSGYAPSGTVAAGDFSLEFTFGAPWVFDLGGCGSLTGYVDAGGTAVTALEGVCTASGGSSTSVDFDPDNTAYIDIPAYLLALNATYTLVPEPAAPLLGAVVAAFAWALRRRA